MKTKNKETSLTRRSLSLFTLCVAALLLLATPLFYLLTTNFYAEDMIKIINHVQQGQGIPPLDLESDVMQGVMIQFGLIVVIMGVAMVVVMGVISRRTWAPFYKTLQSIESFRLDEGLVPELETTRYTEFNRLNATLTKMMKNSVRSYQLQKEFTANASHELQTPLAVFQSKLDILLQQPDISKDQAIIIQDLYQMSGRLSRLSRNLLLLAKMDNHQYRLDEKTDVIGLLSELMPYLESLAQGLRIEKHYENKSIFVRANRSLLESLISNLVANAVRHNKEGGVIILTVSQKGLSVANTSNEQALDGKHIFYRFYRASNAGNGYGLGLAIVKTVCNYHNWGIEYSYKEGLHIFNVIFA